MSSAPDMAQFWNSEVTAAWVTHPERYDRMLEPFGRRVLDAADLRPGAHVLDVGCGGGQLSLQAAERVRPGANVTGIDVSAPLVAVARRRATDAGLTGVDFVEADAQVHQLPPARFQAVISRFGVMFFDDLVGAFANLRAATVPGGRLAFVAWKPVADNPWAMLPVLAMMPHVGLPDLPGPGAPGPFALGDADHVRAVLTGAGWTDVTLDAVATDLAPGGATTVDDAVTYFREDAFGRALLQSAEPHAREAALEALRNMFAEHLTDEGVRMGSAAWIVTAQRPA